MRELHDIQDEVPLVQDAQVHRFVRQVRAEDLPGHAGVALDVPSQVREVGPLQLPAHALLGAGGAEQLRGQARVGARGRGHHP